MPKYTLLLNLTESGAPLPGFPVIREVTTEETLGRQTLDRPNLALVTDPPVDLPLGELGDVNVLMVSTDRDVGFELNDLARTTLQAGGVLLLFNTVIPAAAVSKANIHNFSGADASIIMLAAGAKS